MRTVVVICRKGGTGKTTVAVNLAVAAELQGRDVMLADVDPQHSAHFALSARDRPGPTACPTTGGKLFALKAAAESQGRDLLVIDTPAGLDACVLQAVHVADLCILVTRPNYLDLAAAVMTARTLRQLNMPALVVLNQTPPHRGALEAALTVNAREALRFTHYPVAETALVARAAYARAMSMGLNAQELDPGGPAAAEVQGLWREVSERLFGAQELCGERVS